jgi:tetratricopeptide (TPR) repeat protein
MLRSRLQLLGLRPVVLGALLGLALPAAGAAATVSGVVYSETTNQRILHAAVWLCDGGGNRLQESITSDSGEFTFAGIPTGEFLIQVEAPNYISSSVEVEVNFGTQHGVSVFLRPVKASAKKAPGNPVISAHELAMPAPARALMESGKKKLYGERKPGEALKDFQAAASKAPDYYEAYYQIGMCHLALKNPSEAEHNLEKAVQLSEESFSDADLALATLWLGRHDALRGEPLLLRGLELDPNSWSGFFQLGKLELYRNHLDAALAAAVKARELAPEQALVYRLLSLIHLRQQDDPAVVADLDAYLRLDPDSAEGLTAKRIREDAQLRIEKARAAAPAAPH